MTSGQMEKSSASVQIESEIDSAANECGVLHTEICGRNASSAPLQLQAAPCFARVMLKKKVGGFSKCQPEVIYSLIYRSFFINFHVLYDFVDA
jgi:hypothetical protein